MPQVIRDIFEKELKDYFDVEDVIVVNSGTSALIATLLSLDLDSNSEIITSPFTFIATGNSILFGNSNPVFVDIKEDSKLIDEDLISYGIFEDSLCRYYFYIVVKRMQNETTELIFCQKRCLYR